MGRAIDAFDAQLIASLTGCTPAAPDFALMTEIASRPKAFLPGRSLTREAVIHRAWIIIEEVRSLVSAKPAWPFARANICVIWSALNRLSCRTASEGFEDQRFHAPRPFSNSAGN